MQNSNLKMQNENVKFKKKPGYALVYTLLFIVLLLITVITTWVIGMADIRMQRRSEYSTEAYQLAKAAIDDGWIRYKNEIGTTNPLPSVTIPSSACSTPSVVVRVNPNVTPATSPTASLSPPPLPSATFEGRYDYRICTTAGTTTIEGIGYYRGNKITLKATVNHDHDQEYCDGAIGSTLSECQTNGGTWKINHDGDYLTIFQTGPS